jgi:hypothetical protein
VFHAATRADRAAEALKAQGEFRLGKLARLDTNGST